MNSTKELKDILADLGFSSIEKAASQHAKLFLMGKISKYQAEDNFYINKYSTDFETFSKKVSESPIEDFEHDDDLMDWEFAVTALKNLQRDIEVLENV